MVGPAFAADREWNRGIADRGQGGVEEFAIPSEDAVLEWKQIGSDP
jgi:hypothetical protein